MDPSFVSMDILPNVSEVNLLLPRVELKKSFKKIRVSGVSRMADPGGFYIKLAEKLENVFFEFSSDLYIDFYFEYLNTGSSKWLYYVLHQLESLLKDGGNIEIIWRYDSDDESIQEVGEVLKSQLKVPFILTPL
jgi:hypothetical protein